MGSKVIHFASLFFYFLPFNKCILAYLQSAQQKWKKWCIIVYGTSYGSVWQYVQLYMALCMALYGTMYGFLLNNVSTETVGFSNSITHSDSSFLLCSFQNRVKKWEMWE